MNIENLDVVVKVAACFFGKDGVISQPKEEAILASLV